MIAAVVVASVAVLDSVRPSSTGDVEAAGQTVDWENRSAASPLCGSGGVECRVGLRL